MFSFIYHTGQIAKEGVAEMHIAQRLESIY